MARTRALLASLLVSALAASPAIVRAAPSAPVAVANGPATGPSTSANVDALRRGVVQVERAGRPIAVGTVLANDGRVITSLSALGERTSLDLRYADGTIAKANLGHKDEAWDLALLVPQSGRWLDGLAPTDTDPSGLELKAFLPSAGKLAARGVAFKGRVDARTREGEALRSALGVDLKGSPAVLGAPLFGPSGKVVGMLVRACKEGAAASRAKTAGKEAPPAIHGAKHPSCTPITIGAPVYALRSFLMKTPSSAVQPVAWLGLGGAPTESGHVKGIRVVGIAPGSPAQEAGLSTAADEPDVIVAVDATPVETPEQLAELIAKCAVGQRVKLLVYRHERFREVPVTLRAAP